jgi:preprotein translocase subunit SecE
MATQTDEAPAERPTRPGRPAKGSGRTTPALFVRQVVAELRKVIWPTRHELVTYTTVALVFIAVMVGLVTGLDALLGKIVLEVFG